MNGDLFCIDCGANLGQPSRGRRRLRCGSCIRNYKYASKMGRVSRVCLGGCGTDLTGSAGSSYCQPCGEANQRAIKRRARERRASASSKPPSLANSSDVDFHPEDIRHTNP